MCLHTAYIFHSLCQHTTRAPSVGPGYVAPQHCDMVTAWLKAYHEQPCRTPQPIPMPTPRACPVNLKSMPSHPSPSQVGVLIGRSDSCCPACQRREVSDWLKSDEGKGWRRAPGKDFVALEKKGEGGQPRSRRRAHFRGRARRMSNSRDSAWRHQSPQPKPSPRGMASARQRGFAKFELSTLPPLDEGRPASSRMKVVESQGELKSGGAPRLMAPGSPLIREDHADEWADLPYERKRTVTGADHPRETASDTAYYSDKSEAEDRQQPRRASR